MPKYQIEDTETGRKMVVEGEAPPSDDDVRELFASQSPKDAAPAQQQSGPELRSISPAQKAKDKLNTVLYKTSEAVLPLIGGVAAPLIASPGIAATGPAAPAVAAAAGAAGYAGGKALHRTLFPQNETLLDAFKKTGSDLQEGMAYELLGPAAAKFGSAVYRAASPKAAAGKQLLDGTDLEAFARNRQSGQDVLDTFPGAKLTPGQLSNDSRILARERQTINEPDQMFNAFMAATRQPNAKTRIDMQKAGNVQAVRNTLDQRIPGNFDDTLYELMGQQKSAQSALKSAPKATIGETGERALSLIRGKQAADAAKKNQLYDAIPSYDLPMPNLQQELGRIRGQAYDLSTQRELDAIAGHIDRVLASDIPGTQKAQAIQRSLNQRFTVSTPGAAQEFDALKTAMNADRAGFDDAVKTGDIALYNGQLVYPGKINAEKAGIEGQIAKIQAEMDNLPQGYNFDELRKAVMLDKNVPQIAKDTLIGGNNMSADQANQRVVDAYKKYIGEPPTQLDPRISTLESQLADKQAGITRLDDVLNNIKPADEVAGPAAAANDFYKGVYSPKYKDGTVGQVLQKGNESNRLALTPEEIGRRFTQSPTQAQDLIRTVGKDEAAGVMRNWYQSEIKRIADEGGYKQVQSFINRNRDTINAYGIGQDVWPLMKASRDTEALNKVIGMDSNGFVQSIIDRADNGKAAAEIMARVRGNKAAEQGLQRKVSEYLQEKMASSELITGEEGMKQISSQLKNYDKALKIIYRNNPGGYQAIKQAQQLLTMEQRINKVQGTPGSQTGEITKGAISTLTKILTPVIGGGAGMAAGFGAAGAAGVTAGAALAARQVAINRYLTKAMFEPETARELIRVYKGNPESVKKAGKTITNLMYATQPVGRAQERMTQTEEPPEE